MAQGALHGAAAALQLEGLAVLGLELGPGPEGVGPGLRLAQPLALLPLPLLPLLLQPGLNTLTAEGR